ncbi:hypothetical protein GA0074695_0083 [Micromonospora viridifaciens]|uniref:Secreted protein n=1 Tax=Micromonospora viridifaciens TaxID=1881 RepID=A0A1C4U237_MICVI|nr:hypothetical protein [Micromonospora viridifaciens]SCE65726.1 hypothetical protein GA0074695_0083 [Micromonospora viridifaciens]
MIITNEMPQRATLPARARRIGTALAAAAVLATGGTLAVASPAAAGPAPVGNCPASFFYNQSMYYLTDIWRGRPPLENDRYLYGMYWRSYNGEPASIKRVCGPI